MSYISYMRWARVLRESPRILRRLFCPPDDPSFNLFNSFTPRNVLSPLFTALALALHADAAPTFHSSLKLASEAAATDRSLVLLVFSADWCAPCKALKK